MEGCILLSAIFLAAFVCPTGDSGEAAREFPKASLSSAAFFSAAAACFGSIYFLFSEMKQPRSMAASSTMPGAAANAAPSAFISL